MLVLQTMTHQAPPPYTPADWSTGTDAEIVDALEKHYAGKIDLRFYWSVGDERIVHLSAMSATGVGESHEEQDVTLVLSNIGGKYFEDDTECLFQVDQKGVLYVPDSDPVTIEKGYYDSSINTWDRSARRTWCNNVYLQAIPKSLRSIFKRYKNITADGSGSETITSLDYFALRAEKEIYGVNTYANPTAESNLSQIEWYETASNRIKKAGRYTESGYYTRSARNQTDYKVVYVSDDGTSDNVSSSYLGGIAPFGCI